MNTGKNEDDDIKMNIQQNLTINPNAERKRITTYTRGSLTIWTNEQRKKILNKCINVNIDTNIPFNIYKKESFIDLTKSLLVIGNECNIKSNITKKEVSRLLPHRTNVAKNILQQKDKINKLSSKLINSQKYISFSTDLYSSKFFKKSCIVLNTFIYNKVKIGMFFQQKKKIEIN